MNQKPNKKRNILTLIGIIILFVLLIFITTSSSINSYREISDALEDMSVDEAE